MKQDQEPGKSNNTRLVVAALLTGSALKSRDIAGMVSGISGKDIQPSQVAAILSRISDPEKCEFGHFVRKHRDGNTLVYSMVGEALGLPEDTAYGLVLKTGREACSLEQVISDFPGLRRYVPQPEIPAATVTDSPAEPPAPRPAFRMIRKMADTLGPGRLFQMKSEPGPEPTDRTMEISVKYSSHYAMSLTASFTTFLMICCGVVLTFALCCFLAYTFFYPVLILGVMAASVCIAMLIWKAWGRR